jgi:hypothetical protein
MLPMAKNEPFDTLDAVHLHRDALRAKRQDHATAIRSHWSTLGEAEFRSGVVNGAMRGLWKAWSPMDTLRTAAGQPADLSATLLGLALGGRARTGWGRALIWVASAAMPLVLDRLKENERVQHFMIEFQHSWQRIIQRWRERGAANDQHRA